MDELAMAPIYRQGLNEHTDGIEIFVPTFCAKNCTIGSKCENFYRQIMEKQGIQTCPYGFNAYVFLYNDETVIFSCLRIEGYYDKKKTGPKLKREEVKSAYRVLRESEVERYAELYKKFAENNSKYEVYQGFVNNIFHDLRKFNAQLKAKSDSIYKRAESSQKNRQDFMNNAQSIRELCWFITLRLNSYDFVNNEELLSASPKSTYNLYRAFDKVRICINERAKQKNIKIKLYAERDCSDIKAYDCIELLPVIFLDNAIKYAPCDTEIDIRFIEKNDKQKVTIKSVGPVLLEFEHKKIFQRGYRGENCKKLTDDGMGIGLSTAKKICELHDIDMQIKSSTDVCKKVRNIEYSEFLVNISLSII